MSNYTNIGQKLEEFRSQFEASRKNFKTIANELKPMLFQNSELDSRISENNRIIDTFLTSIKNTIDFNIDKLQEFVYERSLEDLSKNFFVQCFKNENYEAYQEEEFPKKISPPKSFCTKVKKINYSDDSYQKNNENQLNTPFHSPSYSHKPDIEKNLSHPHYFYEDKIPKIISESEQYISGYDSFKNDESFKSSKEFKNRKTYKRGPYRSYGITLKQEAIKMMEEEGKDLKQVSSILKVPTKNLKRWLKVGPLRQKGGGRKTMDPEMEAMLFEWCLNEINRNKKPISRSSIKQQAKVLSQNKGSFKASKGWLDKFMKRFNYSERMKNILNEAKRGKMEEENKEKEKNDTKINIFADNIFHFSLSKKENNNMI